MSILFALTINSYVAGNVIPIDDISTDSPYSVAFWVKKVKPAATVPFSIAEGGSAGDVIRLNLTGDEIVRLRYIETIGANTSDFDFGTKIIIRTWSHVSFSGLDTTGTNVSLSLNAHINGVTTGPFPAGPRVPVGMDNITLGLSLRAVVEGPSRGGNIAEVAVWSVDLDLWERELLSMGLRPNTIRPESLLNYASFKDDYTDEAEPNMNWTDSGTLPTSISTDHPTMLDPVEARYPIQQDGFDENALDTSIADYRATRLVNNFVVKSRATQVQWEITPVGGTSFTYTTTANSESTGDPSVFNASLTTLDLWLPPASNYMVRTRQYIDGAWTYWSLSTAFTSLGYINSFEKYTILNRGTISTP